ncbi:MAG TPA: Sec-dependent nitrous-oxide reductase [Thermoanaerobaculia bacterium]
MGVVVAVGAAGLLVTLALVMACGVTQKGAAGDFSRIAEERGLSPDDMSRALKTFVPPGQHDEYFLFASGGHSGQVHVFGVPSMRLLKTIAVFTPEPWQGYGYGADWGEAALAEGNGDGTALRWGDSHHPALSETDGDYDGRWLYINDRSAGRIAMVDLTDFRTKQILAVPNIQTSHGGIFATPDTRYVHISSMVPALKGWNRETGGKVSVEDHLERYGEIYRGYSTFLRVDPETGRLLLDESFQLELPPYTQDLADSGKGVSYGWAFINSYNAERATGGTDYGRPALEAGASELDFDFLHLVHWQKAEEVIAAGEFEVVNGMRVIPLETVVARGLLYLVPEPRSPHGVDVSPNGNYLSVSGKLDPHVTIYGFDRIQAAIEKQDFEGHDDYGIPILRFDAAVAGQVEVGAGPLHTQYDADGYGYTSLFLESAVAKWSLGPPYHEGEAAFQLVDKVPVHYNIGHLATAHGDTAKPHGRYLVALNKWSIDRHPNVGPLHPQNFQLVDLTGEKMEVLADLPIGIGEPHYAQLVRADVLKPNQVYELGTSSATSEKSPGAAVSAQEARIERRPGEVEVWMTLVRSHFKPDIVPAKVGDKVIFHITNLEQTPDATHGFAIPGTNVMVSLDPGETTTVEMVADKPGSYSFYCTEFCSALHLEMQGWLVVEEG